MIEHYLFIFVAVTYFPAYYLTHKIWGKKHDLGGLPVLTSVIWPICLLFVLFTMFLDKLSTEATKGELSMRNNTTSKHTTRFLKGAELVHCATLDNQIPNENWETPTGITFGDVNDEFYAEVWENGMDFSINYWVVYQSGYDDPKTEFLFSLGDDNILNSYDRNIILIEMLKALRSEKCDGFNFKLNEDEFCYFTFKGRTEDGHIRAVFEHASQRKIELWINPTLFRKTLNEYLEGTKKKKEHTVGCLLKDVEEARKAGLSKKTFVGNSKLKK